MKRNLKLLLLLALAAVLSAAAEETNSGSQLDYSAFRIIPERNIFNQSRSRGSSRNGSRSRQDRRVRADAFALRGTMSYEKGRFAFFDGTSSDYRKAVQADDSIAGFKVAQVGVDSVKLQSNGKQIELQVGMQMKKPDQGEWEVASGAEVIDLNASTSTADTNSVATNTEASSSPSSGGESDILKRLMQRREQQLGTQKPEQKNPGEDGQNEKR